MDLSINNINLKKNVSFKGLEGAYNAKSEPVYRFYAPAHSEGEKVYLELVPLSMDEKTAQFKQPTKDTKVLKTAFNEDGVLDITQKRAKKLSQDGFGYRFIIESADGKTERPDTDSFKSIKYSDSDAQINVITHGNFYGVSPKGGTMYHGFLDSVGKIDKDGKLTPKATTADFTRNHFNKFGGSIKGLNELLMEDSSELDAYGYFMTTPDIGADRVSSHRYWPANHYQCSDLETFKDFNFNLFKKGKGYVADGAFTSQGIQSPLVQHVLKWGDESPFRDWLKIDGRLSLGVLPDFNQVDGENPYEHIGVRLVNPKGDGYDPKKPTYIQFYDERLLSEAKQNSGKLEFNYDKPLDDIYEITTHQDSVQPYAFEIDPNDPKIKAFGGQRAKKLKEIEDVSDFLTFENFTIGTKNKVAGATYWDGNVDIIKMNLSNPVNTSKNIQGFTDARNYLLGVADYWTDTVQSHLILQTAKDADKKSIAKANGISEKLFNQIAGSVKEDGGFVSRVLDEKIKRSSEDIIRNFPLQTLETSEELSAIFAQPKFNEKLFDKETLNSVSSQFDKIVKTISANRGAEYETFVEKVYGNQILRYIFASAMDANAVTDDKVNVENLRKVTLKSIDEGRSASPAEEVDAVVKRIKSGLKKVDTKKLTDKLSAEAKGITLENFKLAEAIVLQGKGGLNWRFDAAKDIGDLDAVRAGKKTFNQIWNADAETPGVQQFWADFVSRIRRHNPSAYIINEVTSLNEFVKNYDSDIDKASFDPQLARYYKTAPIKPGETKPVHEYHPIYTKQVQFLDRTNSTTTSEYSKGFNTFSEFAGVNPEKIKKDSNSAGDLSIVKTKMEELMEHNQPNSSIYSHMFVSNHDKPSVLHTLPLDMRAYLAGDAKGAVDVLSGSKKPIIDAILKGVEDYSQISPKAIGVAVPMYETIEKLFASDKEAKERLVKNLQNLVLGKKDDASKPSFKRSEAFGVKPYEATILDLMKKSGIENPKAKTLEFHRDMMKSSMTYFERMWQVMNACVGTPTLYGGSEFAQTGYETPSKNVYLGIRNEVLHGLKDEKGYAEYFKRMEATSKLYQQEGLSALRNGAPVSLDMTPYVEDNVGEKIQACVKKTDDLNFNVGKAGYFVDQISKKIAEGTEESEIVTRIKTGQIADFGIAEDNLSAYKAVVADEDLLKKLAAAVKAKIDYKKATKDSRLELQIWPIFRKDAKGSEVLSIVTNLGMPKGQASFEKAAEETISHELAAGIPLNKKGEPYVGLEGSIFKRVDDDLEYIVKNGVLEPLAGGKITLKDTVTTFYKVVKNLT